VGIPQAWQNWITAKFDYFAGFKRLKNLLRVQVKLQNLYLLANKHSIFIGDWLPLFFGTKGKKKKKKKTFVWAYFVPGTFQ